MNLRALAESDLETTLESTDFGGATAFTLLDPSGTAYGLKGLMGDIGYLLGTDGAPVQGRSVVATFRLHSLAVKTPELPRKGWRLRYADLAGKEWSLAVVRFEPDRTLGIGRLVLSLDLS